MDSLNEPVKGGVGARLAVECPRCGCEIELAVLLTEDVTVDDE